jgi:energy-coupling factor transporter ATPase
LQPLIRIEHLDYTYDAGGPHPVQALRDINLTIHRGEYVAIVGHNGSGKSTLARHLNALLLPSKGDVWIKSWNTKERRQWRNIRTTVGMVFQSPDNQIVATIVEEDVAFGPENLGIPREEIVRRVDWSLEQVDLAQFRQRAPHRLSGGQKQRVCIAGVLAMQPEVLVLDEATALLDPLGRQEVLQIVRRLHKEQGVTVVAITHAMHEAIEADRILVMAEGRIVLEGAPHELFRQMEQLRSLRLGAPQVTELALTLRQYAPDFPTDVLTVEELVAALSERLKTKIRLAPHSEVVVQPETPRQAVITTKDLAHYYMRGTPLAVKAIHDIDMEIHQGEIIGVLGHTGSGKSTVVQHFNALLRPHEGSVTVFDMDLTRPDLDLRTIRRRVGLVFQFPEAQLFEQFVGDDIAYGPRNLNLSREEVRARVRKAMEALGLGFEEYKDRLTFSLSGGQKRRVALAGVLALEPEVLVLDEPTSGLDPQGRRQLLDYILALHHQGVTLVIISHNMEEVAEICHRLYVIADGRMVLEGTPAQVFGQAARLRELGLGAPPVTEVMERLVDAGLLQLTAPVYTLEQAVAVLRAALA